MITKINIFKENFNFNIEKIKPKTTSELINLIKSTMGMYGNECDLNFIDTSLITNMSWLFYHIDYFKGDISKWDVSNVTNMESMFKESDFNGDISEWDISNVTNMDNMFVRSELEFAGRLPKWYNGN